MIFTHNNLKFCVGLTLDNYSPLALPTFIDGFL